MFGSLRLGKLFGIDLYVHGTFWLLPLFVIFGGAADGDLSGAAFDVAVLFALFGCVALHEVGHALAARFYGIGTRDITLYPVGGVASLERMPERPLHEIVVALAGPAVNVVIGLGILAGVLAESALVPHGWSSHAPDTAELFVGRLFWANVALVAFNLIPAFPMDGGRVLRAVLGTVMPRVRATEAAVGVGSVIAAGFFLLGTGSVLGVTQHYLGISLSPMLMVLAVMVYLLGRGELAAVRHQERRRAWRRSYEEFFAQPAAPPADPDAVPFSGWVWDPLRRVWAEWRDGALVREIHTA